MDYKTGTLIEFRNRPWVVQQSGDDDLMIIKPLGGTDAETIGLYLPLYGDELQIHSYNFRRPTAEDIGKNGYKASAKVLYNACRLSFRDIAGPFQFPSSKNAFVFSFPMTWVSVRHWNLY